MTRTKIFFDTEFTGLHKNTTLISIGLMSDRGTTLYCELTDYDTSQVDEWIQTNVVDKLRLNDFPTGRMPFLRAQDCVFKGTKSQVAHVIELWLETFGDVEMWSDCLSYDWVLFCDLWGHAFKVPKNVYYIPFDICPLLQQRTGDADVNREMFGLGSETTGDKHNALWDAMVIRRCHQRLTESTI